MLWYNIYSEFLNNLLLAMQLSKNYDDNHLKSMENII
jgi:hypothetical protein